MPNWNFKVATSLKLQVKKKLIFKILGIVLLVLVSACKESNDDSSKITIAAAANTRYALESIIEKFTTETGINCDLIISSSGKHTAQIIEGAPFDIFVSADMKYPSELFKKGIATSPPEIYAYGKLVLWTMVDGLAPTTENLNSSAIKHIAVANPKTAPYGQAALEVLKKKGLLSNLEPKLVYGESIAQTNQFIYSKSAEIGFTAQSVVLSPKMKDKGNFVVINDSLYTPISQGAVIINLPKRNNSGVKKFYKFLFSKEAKIILKDFGYSVDE